MADAPYDTLAAAYDWLVPEPLLSPEGAAAAFAMVTGGLARGARVLDCAAGTGQLAVGLALQGLAVTATDASPGMIGRTRALAAERGADVVAEVCAWADLPERGWDGRFEAVLCVGNSLVHAPGRAARRAALAAMAGVLAPDGLLAVTSRNWERVRAAGHGLEVADRIVVRDGRGGLVIHAWTLARGLGRAAPARRRGRAARPGRPRRDARRAARLLAVRVHGARRGPACGGPGARVEHVRGRRGPLPGHGATARGRRRWRMSSTVNVTVSAMPSPRARPFQGESSNASPPM